MSKRSGILSMAILLMGAPGVFAKDVAVKQVQIESKFVEVSQNFSKELVIYEPIEARDAKAEFAFVLTPLPDHKTKIEVTSLVFGGGADFRRWVPQNPELIISEPKVVTLSRETSKIYINKASVAAPAAAFLFAAIGSQYEAAGEKAAASPGQVCPITGKPLSENDTRERGDIAKGIDRAGMAAGMGLLTSQAKGQLEGQKSVFIIDAPVLKFQFKTEAYNKDKKQLIMIITPTLAGLPGG